jgi:glycosyltransferase involved in cell wall biosynthesis
VKICYFGHPAHEWSKSTIFFEEMLQSFADLKILRIDTLNVEESLINSLETDYDLYVFFQFDFLAYAFLAAGKAVIIVPMVDGSASYGLNHWRNLREASFISYSRSLHSFLRINRIDSLSLQYWPKPEKYQEAQNNNVYYWPRGSSKQLNAQSILQTFENYPNIKILIRNSNLASYIPRNKQIELVDVKNRSEHLDLVKSSLIFAAPRLSEGIGHSFLESMSFGRTVIARRYPTMSEYLTEGFNGTFFRNQGKPLKPGIDWLRLSKNSYSSVVKGYEEFEASSEITRSFIEKSALSRPKPKPTREVQRLLDLSISIMRKSAFPGGYPITLQNWIRVRDILKI